MSYKFDEPTSKDLAGAINYMTFVAEEQELT